MFYDRLNTKDLMSRKHWQVDGGTTCSLCSLGIHETRDHMFIDCQFATDCWERIHIHWLNSPSYLDRVRQAKDSFSGPLFLEILACAAWNIWKIRNEFIFQDQQPSMGRWRVKFKADLQLHQYRVKSSMVQPLLQWIRDLDF